MTTRFHIPANATLVLTVASILWLSACFDDGIDDSRSSQDSESIASHSVPTPIADSAPEPTPTPDMSFEPTVGMLATVPIGRMPMQCWIKEGDVSGKDYDPRKGHQTFVSASCEVTDTYREFYMEVWKRSKENHISISFIYFEEVGQNQVEYVQCDDIDIVFESTKGKKRGDSLPGVCNRYLHSYENASRKLGTMADTWTTHSGLEERANQADRDDIRAILEVLKR